MCLKCVVRPSLRERFIKNIFDIFMPSILMKIINKLIKVNELHWIRRLSMVVN